MSWKIGLFAGAALAGLLLTTAATAQQNVTVSFTNYDTSETTDITSRLFRQGIFNAAQRHDHQWLSGADVRGVLHRCLS
jgi:hypothetical protein